MTLKVFTLFTFLLFSLHLQAHQGEKHKEKAKTANKQVVKEDYLKKINSHYLKDVKPIYQKKCFDCHGVVSKFPWYYKLYGVKQLMDNDIRTAKEHLDMSSDFPFAGHGTPVTDLEAIKRSIEDDSMPPFKYVIMHWDSPLTQNEEKIILKWVNSSLDKLKENSN
jgi:cytochrome c peroxidase